MTVIAGSGKAGATAEFNAPWGICAYYDAKSSSDAVLIGDRYNKRIQMMNLKTSTSDNTVRLEHLPRKANTKVETNANGAKV